MKKDIQTVKQLVSAARWQLVKVVTLVPLTMLFLSVVYLFWQVFLMFTSVTVEGKGDPQMMANLVSQSFVQAIEYFIGGIFFLLLILLPAHFVCARLNQRGILPYIGTGIVATVFLWVAWFFPDFSTNEEWQLLRVFLSILVFCVSHSFLGWLFIRELPKRRDIIDKEESVTI